MATAMFDVACWDALAIAANVPLATLLGGKPGPGTAYNPETSAHLLAVTPTAHWLEYVDWANAILAEPLRIVDGRDRAGSPGKRAGVG